MSWGEMTEKDYLEELSDLSDRVRQRVAETGLELSDALILEGVDAKIVNKWMTELDTRKELAELKDSYLRARVELEAMVAQRIVRTGKANELISFLERRYSDRYSKKEKSEAPAIININLPEDLKDLAK